MTRLLAALLLTACADVPERTTWPAESDMNLIVNQWWQATESTSDALEGDCIYLRDDGSMTIQDGDIRRTEGEWGATGPDSISFVWSGIDLGTVHLEGGPAVWQAQWEGMLYDGARAEVVWGCEALGYALDRDYPYSQWD